MSDFDKLYDAAPSPVSQDDPLDYSGDVNPSQWAADPRVLRDLRDLAKLEGKINFNDDELVEWYKSRQRWQGTNTASAALGYADTINAPNGKQLIESRLQRVWNSVPNFWQEGGSGTLDALGDYVPAAILDPINIIPVGGSVAKAGKAARAAYAAGKTVEQATSAGFRAGVKTAAIEEAGINALQSGAVDLAQQGREQNLGMRDDISLGQTAIAAGTDALIGGVAGAAMGAIPAGLQAGRVAQQSQDLVNRGLRRPDLEQLSPDQLNELAALPQTTTTSRISDTYPRMDVVTEERPVDLTAFSPTAQAEAEAAALQVQQNAKVASEARNSPDIDTRYEAALAAVERGRIAYQAKLQSLRADGFHELDKSDPNRAGYDTVERDLEEIARLERLVSQIGNEKEQIVSLEAQNTPESKAEAAKRRITLQRSIADVDNAALRYTTKEASDAYVAQRIEAKILKAQADAAAAAEAKAGGKKPAAAEAQTAAPAPAQTATPAAAVPAATPDATPAAPAAAAPKAPDAATSTFQPKPVKANMRKQIEAAGLTEQDVHDFVATGQSKSFDPTKSHYNRGVVAEAKAWKAAGKPSSAIITEAPAAAPAVAAEAAPVVPAATPAASPTTSAPAAPAAAATPSPSEIGERLRTADDEYSVRAREEFMDIMGVVAKADYLDDPSEVRSLFEVLSQSPKYQTSREDLQALLDRWGEIPDEIAGEGSVTADVREVDPGSPLTQTEQKKARRIIRNLMSEGQDEVTATMNAVKQVMSGRNIADNLTEPSVSPDAVRAVNEAAAAEGLTPGDGARDMRRAAARRTTGSKVERASIFTTAGKQMNGRKFVEFIMKGTPSKTIPREMVEEFWRPADQAKGYVERSTITRGVERSEARTYKGDFNRAEAREIANKNRDIVDSRKKMVQRFDNAYARFNNHVFEELSQNPVVGVEGLDRAQVARIKRDLELKGYDPENAEYEARQRAAKTSKGATTFDPKAVAMEREAITKKVRAIWDDVRKNYNPENMISVERTVKREKDGKSASWKVMKLRPAAKAADLAEKHGVSPEIIMSAIRAAAYERKAFQPVGPTIVDYKTSGSETIFTPGGKIKVGKGVTVFYNARDGKTYSTLQQAVWAQGGNADLSPADKRAVLIGALETAKRRGNPDAVREIIEAIARGETGVVNSPDGMRSIGGNTAYLIVARKDQLAAGDPNLEVRKLYEGNKTGDIWTLIGKGDPEDWEIRYTTDSSSTRNPDALRKIWEKSQPVRKAGQWENRFGDAANKQAVPYSDYVKIPVVGVTDAEANAISSGLLLNGEVLSSADLKAISERGELFMNIVRQAQDGLHWNAPLYKTAEEFDAYVRQIEVLNQLEARKAPNGFVLTSIARDKSVEMLSDLFTGYDSTTIATAASILRNLGGDKSKGVEFVPMGQKTLESGIGGRYVFNPAQDRQGIVLPSKALLDSYNTRAAKAANGADPMAMGRMHPIAGLLHELGHWAYRNILTPDDRIALLKAIRKNAFDENGRLREDYLKENSPAVANATASAQELIANEFSRWAMRNRADVALSSDKSWFGNMSGVWSSFAKLKDVVLSLIDRYFHRKPIAPEMEPYFAKILPDNERFMFENGRGRPPESFGSRAKYAQKINERYRELRLVSQDLANAIASDSDDAILQAAENLRNFFRSTTVNSKKSGTFGALLPLQRVLHMRTKDITSVLNKMEMSDDVLERATAEISPDTIDRDEYFDFEVNPDDPDSKMPNFSFDNAADKIEKANTIRRLYKFGYAPDPTGTAYVPPWFKQGMNVEYTSIKSAIDMMGRELMDAHMKLAGRLPKLASPDSIADTYRAASSPTADVRVKRQQNANDRRMNKAVNAALSGEMPADAQNGESSPNVGGVKQLTIQDLAAEWQRVRGTDRAKQIVRELKAKYRFDSFKDKALDTSPVRRFKSEELAGEMLDLIYSGDPKAADRIDLLEHEFARRAIAKVERGKAAKASSLPKAKPVVANVVEAVARELEDSDGLEVDAGIPPNTRANIREMLSFLTHRDEDVAATMRTIAYRMLNLMGKTVRSALSDVNVFSLDELSRLAGVDASPSATGMTVDLRGSAFKSMRNDMRRLSVGLVKGQSDPFDVVHELTHVVVRGVLPDEDRLAVTDMFRLANDSVKAMIEQKYTSKYNSLPTAQREARLAEEWFAESLSQYMAQRVARGDIFKAVTERNVSDLKLRGKVSTAIDRAVEYTAYITNGMIGRKDIRQTFRRLMIYGDMFEAPSSTPILNNFMDRYGVPADLAADYASESMMRNRHRAANMKMYVAGTAGEGPDGAPVVIYHASPNGYALRKNTSPDAVLLPSSAGEFGPGVYTTQNPRAAEAVYKDGRTIRSMTSLIEQSNLPVGLQDDLYDLVDGELASVRDTLSKTRADLAMLKVEADKLNELDTDGVNATLVNDDVTSLERQISQLVARERAVLDTLDRYGIKPDGVVLPLVTNAARLADFRSSTKYDSSDAFVTTLMDKLATYFPGSRQTEMAMASFSAIEKPMSGNEIYKKAIAFLGKLGSKPAEAKAVIAAALKEMGYDGLRASYANQIDDGLSKVDVLRHDGMVIFDAGNLKHIDADEFDAADERLYYRDVNGTPVAASGELMTAMADTNGRVFDEGVFANIVERMDTAGVAPPVIDAMASSFRNRMPDARTVNTMQKFFANTLGTQSGSLRLSGMKWLADRVENFFPGVATRFAKEFYPTLDLIRSLPGADGMAGRWVKRSFGSIPGIGKTLTQQPKSYANVVRALRYGTGSRAEIVLTPKERQVYLHIRDRFMEMHKMLRASGELIGFRDNYLPQIWNPEQIAVDREGFIQTAAEYFIEDRRANGGDLSMEDARKMAERIAARITDDEADAFFPADIQRSNSGADNLDYTRIFELEKMPGFMARMEKYLENDLEAIWTKYTDAAARRLEQNKLFGNNTHGFNDYIKVVNEGVSGIADLLSTKKVYSKPLRGLNADNEMVQGVYQMEIGMPFEGRPDEAMTFARGLVEIHNKGGASASLQAMTELLPPGTNMDQKITYMNRVQAIIGALDDFKGVPSMVAPDDVDRAIKTMALVKRQPLTDAAFGGKAMLNASRGLRAFNAITLLSFTTLTSIPDLTLPIIRSGEFKAWAQAMKNMAQDEDYARLMRNVGVSVESEVHHHMSKLFGTDMSRHTDAFFNATMLTPWTNTMRKIAAATGYETFKIMQDKAFRNYKPGADIATQNAQYKLADRFLKSYGLGDYLPTGAKSKVSLADRTLLASDDTLRLGVVKFTDQAIFAPNPNDVPLWTQTPVGAIVFQLKAYPLMMGRLSKWVLSEARKGNVKPLTYMATLAPAAAASALAIKDIVQMRGGEENDKAEIRSRSLQKLLGYDEKVHGNANDFLGWYVESVMTAGGLGLVGEMIHDIATQVDNGAYGKNRIYSAVFGPSMGTFSSALDIAGGAVDAVAGNPDSNAKERSAVREMIRRVPVLGGIGSVREGITDAVAGEKSTGGKDWESW